MATDTPATSTPTAKPAPAAPPKVAKRASTKPARRAATRTRSAAAPKAASSTRKPDAPKPDRNRAAVLSVLDAQERAVDALAAYQTKAAELSRIPGAETLAKANAELLQRITVTYVTTTRDLLD